MVNKLRYLGFFLTLCLLKFSWSQASLIAVQPAMQCQLDDLWNVQVLGNETGITYYKLRLQLIDAGKGVALDMESAPFVMESGSKIIRPAQLKEISPLKTTYSNPEFMVRLSNNKGYLGIGTYTVNFQLYGTKGDAIGGQYTLITEDRYIHEVILAQPTELISLEDRDTIQTRFPAFSWTPTVMPFVAKDGGLPSKITYVFNLCKLLPNQSRLQAITSNPPVYTQTDLSICFLQYPIVADELEDSSTYVWQVHAYVNAELVSSSEVWEFTIWTKRKEIDVPTPLVRKERTQNFVKIQDNTLGFSYMEEYSGGEAALSFAIYSEKTHDYVALENAKLDTHNGINPYQINLCPNGVNLKDGIYMLELTDTKGQKFYLRFIYSQTDGCY